MATVKTEKAWVSARAAALTLIPGKHKHPTLPGFFMQVSPKLKAIYAYKFRDAKGVQQADKLGDVADAGGGGLTVVEAVAQFESIFRLHKSTGTNASLTLADGFEAWIEADKKDGSGKKADTTKVNYREVYSRRLEAEGGHLVLAKTNGDAWTKILDKAKKVSLAEARIAYWVVSAVYAHYKDLKVLSDNPLSNRTMRSAYSNRASKGKRSTHVAAMNLKLFWEGLDGVANRGHGKTAVRCLLLSGWRLNGVLRMRWEQIDFKSGVYSVTKENGVGWKGYTGPMAINDSFMAYIKERRAKGGEAESEYVFPSSYGGRWGYMTNPYGTVHKASLGLGWRVKPHDLRRTFTTIADVILDSNRHLIGLLIAHRQPTKTDEQDSSQTTDGYVIRDMNAEKYSSNKVSEAILELCGVFDMSSEVSKKFSDRGVRIEALELVDLANDDD